MRLEQYQLRLTYHSHKRYCQRVNRINRRTLYERCLTGLRVGHYRFGEHLIRLYGAWWGCVIKDNTVILTTCYGVHRGDLIAKRAAGETI